MVEPSKPCQNCGNLLEVSLWTTAEEHKLNKHGLYVVSGTLLTSAPPLGGTLPKNTSFFDNSYDLTAYFRYVVASGNPITPVTTRGNRAESLYWFFGHTTGAGQFGGTLTYFSGIRVVNPNSPTYIHLFPDTLRPQVDQYVSCRQCGKSFSVVGLPSNCDDCGYRFWW